MVRCIECGSPLKDKLEDEPPQYDPPAVEEPQLPPGDYTKIADGLSPPTVDLFMDHFDVAGIPIKLKPSGPGLRLSARIEDVPAAVAILEREGVVPKQPDPSERAVASEGGPCPACGKEIRPGTGECPECGLQLAAEAVACERCGSELRPTDEACPACGYRPD